MAMLTPLGVGPICIHWVSRVPPASAARVKRHRAAGQPRSPTAQPSTCSGWYSQIAEVVCITIVPPGPELASAQLMTLTSGTPRDAAPASATLGGAAITGDAPRSGKWDTLPADPRHGISLTVKATTAAIVRIHDGA
jgi:hypothetical protein